MKILLFEDNLLWSVRLARALTTLGHEAVVRKSPDAEPEGAEVAIVNLGSEAIRPPELVPALRARGVKVIGHTGHKEKDLLTLGREAGCDTLATNGEMAHKLEQVLERVTG